MNHLNLLFAGCLLDGNKDHHPNSKKSPAYFAIQGLSLLDERFDISVNISKAGKVIKNAIKLNPDYAYGNLCMGIFYVITGCPEKSFHFFHKAKLLGLNNSYLVYYLALAQFESGQIDQSFNTIHDRKIEKGVQFYRFSKLYRLEEKISLKKYNDQFNQNPT